MPIEIRVNHFLKSPLVSSTVKDIYSDGASSVYITVIVTKKEDQRFIEAKINDVLLYIKEEIITLLKNKISLAKKPSYKVVL